MNSTPPSSPPSFPRIELKDLYNIVEHQDQIEWGISREGVEIHRLYGDGVTGPTAALLRFKKGGKVPMHHHEGYEHILVLAGSQEDENGVVEAGTLRIHPPGTSHSVTSRPGCIVLAIYHQPVRFEVPTA